MCGRFTRQTTAEAIIQAIQGRLQLDLADAPEAAPTWNAAPTQPILCALRDEGSAKHRLALLRWGLIPSWAKDPSIGARMINARSETAAEKPAFRQAMRRRRCLVLADGFYEWQAIGKVKQPWYFRLKGGPLFAFAGLHERWRDPKLGEIASCAILTVEANELVRPFHERMPAILDTEDWAKWCDPAAQAPAEIAPLLRPYPGGRMEAFPVSKLVNSPAHDSPECAAPVGLDLH